ncbi:MAG: aldolase [Bacillota bacterium]|nr:aldolase [Bacillota bacterium]
MVQLKMKYRYDALGLKILSEICLPELSEWKEQNDKPLIEIVKRDLYNVWSTFDEKSRKRYMVDMNQIMFEVPETAIFSIEDGKRIVVSPSNGAEEDKIRLYILGTCIGAVLIQKKILALHGSAVVIDGKAYAFIGESGAGKSTIATALMNKGYPLLSDDIIPIHFYEDTPFVIPTYPQQKLWQESLEQFGMDSLHLSPLFERETKFSVPVRSNFFNQPLPLAGVFELSKTDIRKCKVNGVKGLQQFPILFKHTFRNIFITAMGLRDWHFSESARLVKKISMYQLQRPFIGFNTDQLVELILTSIEMENDADGYRVSTQN